MLWPLTSGLGLPQTVQSNLVMTAGAYQGLWHTEAVAVQAQALHQLQHCPAHASMFEGRTLSSPLRHQPM